MRPAIADIAIQSEIIPLPASLIKLMKQYTWQNNCPVALSQLVLVITPYWGFDHQSHRGELIIRKDLAPQVLAIFKNLFTAKFPIQSIKPIEYFQGNDIASMNANNSSAFNCRTNTSNTNKFSKHSYGCAIDINPVYNPYMLGHSILPFTRKKYLSRDPNIPGLITHQNIAYQIFRKAGWQWGGDWSYMKDYQHFQKKAC